MSTVSEKYVFKKWNKFDESDLLKSSYIVVLHANRIPPHIGMIVGGYYHSLSIKGKDVKVPIFSLIKTIQQRSIAALFIKINTPQTFNEIYLMNRFIDKVETFSRVDIGIATCISPLKLFFEEEFSISMYDVNYLYELLPRLEEENLIDSVCSLHINEKAYRLPFYTLTDINKEIKEIRAIYK